MHFKLSHTVPTQVIHTSFTYPRTTYSYGLGFIIMYIVYIICSYKFLTESQSEFEHKLSHLHIKYKYTATGTTRVHYILYYTRV